jgi:formate dehydrogenase major subunit
MSIELGKLRGIKNGDRVIVETQRGKLEASAIVTSRLKPFNIAGQTIHQIGIPWHFGWIWPKDGGESANLLTPTVGDPNTMIPESKAFMANVSKLTKQPAQPAKKATKS